MVHEQTHWECVCPKVFGSGAVLQALRCKKTAQRAHYNFSAVSRSTQCGNLFRFWQLALTEGESAQEFLHAGGRGGVAPHGFHLAQLADGEAHGKGGNGVEFRVRLLGDNFLKHALLAGGDGTCPGEPVIERATPNAHSGDNLRAWNLALFQGFCEFFRRHHNAVNFTVEA